MLRFGRGALEPTCPRNKRSLMAAALQADLRYPASDIIGKWLERGRLTAKEWSTLHQALLAHYSEIDRKRRADQGRPRMTTTERRFCPLALTDWLWAARRANIPHISGNVIAELRRDHLLRFDEPGPHQKHLADGMEKVLASIGPGSMVRWDCCASSELKHDMASRGTADHRKGLTLDDPRLLDILMEWPRETIPIVRRPWTTILTENGWPREYRAFVSYGQLQGISSYYPQRPLKRNEQEITEVRRLTEKLILALPAPFQWGTGAPARAELFAERHAQVTGEPRSAPDLEQIHFTADFAVTCRGVEFLEGGPPHALGADPCCFREGRIYGVALKPRRVSRTP